VQTALGMRLHRCTGCLLLVLAACSGAEPAPPAAAAGFVAAAQVAPLPALPEPAPPPAPPALLDPARLSPDQPENVRAEAQP
jgi:hypothetical protein